MQAGPLHAHTIRPPAPPCPRPPTHLLHDWVAQDTLNLGVLHRLCAALGELLLAAVALRKPVDGLNAAHRAVAQLCVLPVVLQASLVGGQCLQDTEQMWCHGGGAKRFTQACTTQPVYRDRQLCRPVCALPWVLGSRPVMLPRGSKDKQR